MHLGFGLYRHMLDDDHFAFARQCGATHVVVHMVDYFKDGDQAAARSGQPVGALAGWGVADGAVWTVEELRELKIRLARHGLQLFAIENFDPAHWSDILFDGPRRQQQIETVKTLIRNAGAAGVRVIGYYFSLAGVFGRTVSRQARGGASSVGMNGVDEFVSAPLPNSMAWNMVVEPGACGDRPAVDVETVWHRLTRFLQEVVPVAEAAGVTLAAHPDDPPLDVVRGQPRLITRPQHYQRLLDLVPNPANALEFCLGTVAEMPEGDVYDAIDRYSRQRRVAYLHFRNVRGRAPHYHETFIDEGDVDMPRVLRILRRNGFKGVLIPDHAPQMTCDAPWHAGMAFAMGYMSCLLRSA